VASTIIRVALVSYAAFTRRAKSPDRRCVSDRCLLLYRCSSVGQWWSAARIRACVRACLRACVHACVHACSVPYHSFGKLSSPARSCKVRVNARFEERLFLRERESDTQVTERNAARAHRASELSVIMTRPKRKVIDSGIPRRERRWETKISLSLSCSLPLSLPFSSFSFYPALGFWT